VLRRTFAEFTPAERRKLGEKAKGMSAGIQMIEVKNDNFDFDRAAKVIPTIEMLLGKTKQHSLPEK
jgi:hypothetical protein